MEEKTGINVIIEKETKDSKTIFIASSSDVNVFAEGKDIDEARNKFIEGVTHHFQTFTEEKKLLMKKERFEMPMIQRIFL